jgi:D-alanyl-D-alanine carboxypeptidase
MRVTVEQCILGMVTVSANDAAAAVGELLGGSEHRFSQEMTLTARHIGMRNTVFRNASGLPEPSQVTTARDMAVLARALIERFPAYYRYFRISRFVFHGRTILGHDPLLGTYPGVDGLKTGFTSAAGFNLATSAERGGVRIIGIVLGAPSSPLRTATMVSLLDQGFARYDMPSGGSWRGLHGVLPRLIPAAEAAEPAVILRPPPRPPEGYGVQVGTFATHATALAVVRRTVATVGGVAHVRRVSSRRHAVWQSQVVSLTHAGAMRACPARERHAGHCFIMAPHDRRQRR